MRNTWVNLNNLILASLSQNQQGFSPQDIQCKEACPCHKGGKWKMGAMGSKYRKIEDSDQSDESKHSHEKKHGSNG